MICRLAMNSSLQITEQEYHNITIGVRLMRRLYACSGAVAVLTGEEHHDSWHTGERGTQEESCLLMLSSPQNDHSDLMTQHHAQIRCPYHWLSTGPTHAQYCGTFGYNSPWLNGAVSGMVSHK